ncbi:MAG: hypothetical protein IPJ65_09645 [Archangiaceae bacterium]|nr:hypothetical protein [Archangiaceae bacterium]
MTRFAFVLSLAVVSATCGPKPDMMPIDMQPPDAGVDDAGMPMVTGPDCRPCDSWGGVEAMGPLASPLDELSGLASSTVFPGVIYAHNDSGDSARFFALDITGFELGELTLTGPSAIDWEDIARGPCDQTADAGSCVFLADIGDNNARRPGYTIYRVKEPTLSAVLSGMAVAPITLDLAFDALPFVYPNGTPHNAEAFLAHPQTGDLYLISKEGLGVKSHVYKFPQPLTPGVTATLVDLGEASFPKSTDSLVTAGDIHPCGRSLLVRMYNRVVELRAAPDAGFESAFTAEPLEAPSSPDEPQGEAVTWGVDGQSYFTASEQTGQAMHRVRCARAP